MIVDTFSRLGFIGWIILSSTKEHFACSNGTWVLPDWQRIPQLAESWSNVNRTFFWHKTSHHLFSSGQSEHMQLCSCLIEYTGLFRLDHWRAKVPYFHDRSNHCLYLRVCVIACIFYYPVRGFVHILLWHHAQWPGNELFSNWFGQWRNFQKSVLNHAHTSRVGELLNYALMKHRALKHCVMFLIIETILIKKSKSIPTDTSTNTLVKENRYF